MFLCSAKNATMLVVLLQPMFVVKMDIETVLGTMYHMFQWLPLISVISMRLRSSIQCSSMQKMCRRSHDPVMYIAEKEV
jgi:type III secretory pathway component EscT